MIVISSDYDWNTTNQMPSDYYDNPNIEKLKLYHLPVFENVAQLFRALNISVAMAKKFFYPKSRRNFLYRRYRMPKKKGGYREISVPCIELMDVQRVINSVILSKFSMSGWSTGFKKNISLVENARPHLGAKTLIKMDITDFFGNITYKKINKQFKYYGYGNKVSQLLSWICVDSNDKLPQGAPTSPALSNLVCVLLDKRIGAYCQKYGLTYTRYADDITITSKKKLSKNDYNDVIKFVTMVVCEEGFQVNGDKTHVFFEGQRMSVTGISINNGILKPSKKIIKELDDALYFITKYGMENHLEKINCHKTNYEGHLLGLASYVYMIDNDLGAKYLKRLNTIFGREENEF